MEKFDGITVRLTTFLLMKQTQSQFKGDMRSEHMLVGQHGDRDHLDLS